MILSLRTSAGADNSAGRRIRRNHPATQQSQPHLRFSTRCRTPSHVWSRETPRANQALGHHLRGSFLRRPGYGFGAQLLGHTQMVVRKREPLRGARNPGRLLGGQSKKGALFRTAQKLRSAHRPQRIALGRQAGNAVRVRDRPRRRFQTVQPRTQPLPSPYAPAASTVRAVNCAGALRHSFA